MKFIRDVGLGLAIGAILALIFLFLTGRRVNAACETVPVTANTPTGIAGCERWGDGTASHYGPGSGVAMNYCTWALRHNSGCGSVTITSHETGRSVTAAVIDYCDCWTGTADERIVDLQYGVVEALGLDLVAGLYDVTVWPATTALPDTAMGAP